MKFIITVIVHFSATALAQEKSRAKDFSKYQKIDTSHFVDLNRAPSSASKGLFRIACVDREGRDIPSSDYLFGDCTPITRPVRN